MPDVPTPTEQVDALRASKDITFGSIAGMAAKVFEHPFDLCKVRLQSQVLDKIARFDGPMDCLYKTWRYEGIRGLYRGLPPPIVGAAAENATLFLTYNNVRRGLAHYEPWAVEQAGGTPLKHTIIAATAAGAVTSFVLTPIELIKCKMQVQMIAANPMPDIRGASVAANTIKVTDLPGPIAILRTVIQAEGFRGLWLGHTGTLIRESGGGAAWFGIKEVVSDILLSRRQAPPNSAEVAPIPISSSFSPPSQIAKPEMELKPWESALSGACAGVGYTFLLFPADCVKSTIQTEEELRPRGVSAPKSTFLGTFRDIYRSKGMPGLYAGAGITGFRSAISSGLMFLIYDALEKHLG